MPGRGQNKEDGEATGEDIHHVVVRICDADGGCVVLGWGHVRKCDQLRWARNRGQHFVDGFVLTYSDIGVKGIRKNANTKIRDAEILQGAVFCGRLQCEWQGVTNIDSAQADSRGI